MNKPHLERYPPIADYALISDCHCTALVSRTGSVDWCCMPRMDADSCYGRLLDWDKGGFCALHPDQEDYAVTRKYIPGTMVVETHFTTAQAEAKLYDFFIMEPDAEKQTLDNHVRIVEGLRGTMALHLEICPRFDYGEIIPRMRGHGGGIYTATGGNKGLVIQSDIELQVFEHRDLEATFTVAAGERKHLLVRFEAPERVDEAAKTENTLKDADAYLAQTTRWWSQWTRHAHAYDELDPQTLRSVVLLKSLMYERTGAIAAAATTSLPESIGSSRNWDYRFSWVRDSVFTVRALYGLGYHDEASRFLQFIQRTSAGSAEQLQIMYGVDGKRRLTEIELDWLEGYRQSRPVRIGNRASEQNQLDVYGEIMEIGWLWHSSGHPIDRHYWDFLADVVNTVSGKWHQEDHGIWEFRGRPRHYVHSKALCWAAVDHGIKLARSNGFSAPVERWEQIRNEIGAAIEKQGYDDRRGVFIQAFDSDYLDASLLLLPRTGFVAYDDPRMVRTTDAVCATLDHNGLLTRYDSPDGLPGKEGAFLPCTFWLVTCLAYQGRIDEAWQYYERAIHCANDVGLFAEEYDIEQQQMLGNFPQGLTHVSQIVARAALMSARSTSGHSSIGRMGREQAASDHHGTKGS
ncbi:glycoside hydrolase family 15 protein [Noviherbaspirillum massiliense]|uniref:glycoside hydrolase family 15 protein n=1 Tax=Noviherbaspirillum massiliense TaxID=1465823 RepID=UPI0002ED1975|nr:glycoside hydrolase family 15 protein [Noviherbaspirillum massiliense]